MGNVFLCPSYDGFFLALFIGRKKEESMKQGNNQAWFKVCSKDGEKFLEFAKNKGCTWINGKEINPKLDHCGPFMGMGDGSIGYISCFIFGCCHKNKNVINFK